MAKPNYQYEKRAKELAKKKKKEEKLRRRQENALRGPSGDEFEPDAAAPATEETTDAGAAPQG